MEEEGGHNVTTLSCEQFLYGDNQYFKELALTRLGPGSNALSLVSTYCFCGYLVMATSFRIMIMSRLNRMGTAISNEEVSHDRRYSSQFFRRS